MKSGRLPDPNLEFAAAVDQFIEAATDGRSDRAERLLAVHAAIARRNFYAALLLVDGDAVEARLAERPEVATAPGGPRGWQPLHYVCYTSIGARSGGSEEGLVAIARRLLSPGGDAKLRI